MGSRVFFSRSAVTAALLLGVLGCEDRARPEFIGTGNGVGPLIQVTAPAELDTVQRGVSFTLGLRIGDEDGVDSVWVVPSDTLMAPWRFSGSGETIVLASNPNFSVSNVYQQDTLVIEVRGVDLLGDTGVVSTRHLIVQ